MIQRNLSRRSQASVVLSTVVDFCGRNRSTEEIEGPKFCLVRSKLKKIPKREPRRKQREELAISVVVERECTHRFRL
ncbi:hypothetical protein SLE2022_363470 [Rubroshorea leprosula]